MSSVVASLLLMGGCFFFVVAALGLLRLPDIMCRGHAVAKASALGVTLILLAVLVAIDGEPTTHLVVLATIAFQFLTIPLSAHLYGRLIYHLQGHPDLGDELLSKDHTQEPTAKD